MKYTIPFRYGMTAVCAMLLAGGCHKKEKDETASAPEVDVAVAYEDSVVLHKSFPGTIVANDNAEVVARVSGQVLETPFKEGQYVRKGQTLFIIDPAPYRDAAARAEAELATAESSYSYASSHYEAMKEALKEDAVSRMEVLQAESAMNQAAAAIKSAKASLSTARENLGFCTVRAPISGNVSEIMQTKGNFVNGGASPVVLTKIFDNNNLSAQFEVSAPLYQTMVAANGGAESAFFSKVPLEFIPGSVGRPIDRDGDAQRERHKYRRRAERRNVCHGLAPIRSVAPCGDSERRLYRQRPAREIHLRGQRLKPRCLHSCRDR